MEKMAIEKEILHFEMGFVSEFGDFNDYSHLQIELNLLNGFRYATLNKELEAVVCLTKIYPHYLLGDSKCHEMLVFRPIDSVVWFEDWPNS